MNIQDKLGINIHRQNTLNQNLKQIKNFKNKQVLLIGLDGKQLYYGVGSNIPSKFLNCKVKSINKSIKRRNLITYVLLLKSNTTNTDIKFPLLYNKYYIRKIKLGDKDSYVVTKEKTPKSLTGAPLYSTLEEAKGSIDSNVKLLKRNEELDRLTKDKIALEKKQEEEWDRNFEVKSMQSHIDWLNNLKISKTDYTQRTISLNNRKRTINVQRLSSKMYRMKVSKGKWITYNQKAVAKRLYMLLDERKLYILN